ncbi:MAG: hypothetical protein ACP5QT_07845 [Brevinematia bacterium]
MEYVEITKEELKNIVHDAVEEALIEILIDRDKRENFLEILEDFCFGKMIEEGDTGEYVDESIIMDKIREKIK